MKIGLARTATLLLFASIARADGDGPSREMNPAEKSAYAIVKKTVRDATSSPLENYSISRGGFEDRTQVSEGMKADQMLRMSFEIKYTISPEFMEKQSTASVVGRTKGTPQQQSKMAELQARNAELKKARDKAKDRDEKDRVRAELKGVRDEENRLTAEIVAQIQSWAAAGGGVPAMQEISAALPPRELDVRVQINQDVRIGDKARPYPLAGYPMAFEQGCTDAGSYCVSVLLGPFEKAKRAGESMLFTLRNTPLGVPTKPRGLVVVVSGPKGNPEKVAEVLGKVDLEKLSALLPR